MIDGHVMLSQPYSYENLMEYVKAAEEKGLDGIVVLEPTWRFKECRPLYREVCFTFPCQKKWYEERCNYAITTYQQFIEEMRKKEFPIKVSFGLEVTYFTQHENFIQQIKDAFSYDVFVGCIHFLDNVAFAWETSHEMLWDKYNAGFLYRRYFEMMNAMLTSKLFDQIAGFDTIKALQVTCPYRLQHTYHKMAHLMKDAHIRVEDDKSLSYRYHHPDAGLAKEFVTLCKELGITILTVSNARKPNEVGQGFDV